MKTSQIAQASLEASLAIAFFLTIFLVFLASAFNLQQRASETSVKSNAIAEAKKCATIIDALYANSGGKPKTRLQNCVPQTKHEISVQGFEHEKTAFTLSPNMTLVQTGTTRVLEVQTPDHYR